MPNAVPDGVILMAPRVALGHTALPRRQVGRGKVPDERIVEQHGAAEVVRVTAVACHAGVHEMIASRDRPLERNSLEIDTGQRVVHRSAGGASLRAQRRFLLVRERERNRKGRTHTHPERLQEGTRG